MLVVDHDYAEELRALARLTRRLVPSYRDPHEFHEQKDQIAKRLAALARQVESSMTA